MHEQKIIFNFDALQKAICSEKSINDYYIAIGPDNWLWLNNSKKNLPGELWQECKNFPGYSASNFGRICDNNGNILQQYEESYKNYSPDEIVKLLKTNAEHVGWLCVDVGPNGGAQYVYKMVADAWLEYDKNAGLEIHHITNDGYDNRPYNLIPLDAETHKKIKHNIYNNCDYRGPNCKF